MYSLLYRRGYIYWSDANSDKMYRSNFDGTAIRFLANATHEDIGKIRISELCITVFIVHTRFWLQKSHLQVL